jgi:hypothetical protein
MKSVAMPAIDAEPKKKNHTLERIGCLFALLAGGFIVFAMYGPSFLASRASGQLTQCKANLKNIADACEMYAVDFEGEYPKDLILLTPNYLKTIPECPAAGEDTYSLHFENGTRTGPEDQKMEPYFTLRCSGENHKWARIKPDFPTWNSDQGLSLGQNR